VFEDPVDEKNIRPQVRLEVVFQGLALLPDRLPNGVQEA
jgi:hypothetical protein